MDSGRARGDRRGISLGRLKTFQSFQNPVYRIYYGAMAGQWASMSMQMITRSLLVYRLTGSAAAIGIIAIAQAIPSFLVALFGGAIADRTQKKYLLVIGQSSSAAVSLGVALTLTTGYLRAETWWVLAVAAAAQGTVTGAMMPARMSIIPEIVGAEQVMNAISLSSTGQTLFRLLGPALAGFLIEAYDFTVIYYLMTGMYLIGTMFAIALPRTSVTKTTRSNPLADVASGLKYVRQDTAILLVVIFGLVHVVCGQPFMQLMTVFTEDILKVGASGLGILTSVSGAGALCGSLVIASLPNRKRGLILLFSGIIMGLSVMAFSWSHWWYLSLAIMPFAGLGPTMHMTMTATLVQYYSEPGYRGRMQSLVMMGQGLASLGTFLAGVLAESIGIQWAVGGMAFLLTVISFLYVAFAREVTRLE